MVRRGIRVPEVMITFSGYIVGRIGDWYGGHLNFFHHWVYGIILIIAGLLIHDYVILFGIGLFISDFKDFYNFEFYGPDKKIKKRFWWFD